MKKTMTDDWSLLKNYARSRDQESFAKLVARYADFTFHIALRRTRRHQLAEDVTQAVFIALARSATSLKPAGSLSAWLHKTTLFASSAALRGESRRRKRELATVPREAADGSLARDESTVIIDEELNRLASFDRDLLSLHYLEDRTMKQTAEALHLSLEGARKRLTRALKRLRTRLSARGVTMSTAGVAGAVGAISASSSLHAPAQVATTILAGGQSGQAFALASRIVQAIRFALLRKAIAATAAICLIPTAAAMLIQRGPVVDTSPPTMPATPVTFAIELPAAPAPATQPTTLPGLRVELPDAIRKALVRNAEQIGPIDISVTMRSSSTYTKEQAIEQLKLDENLASLNSGARQDTRMEWHEGKYRSTFRTDALHLEGSFDGETIYTADVQARPDNPDVRPQGTVSFRLPIEHTPSRQYKLDYRGFTHAEAYFQLAGFRLPLTIGELKSSSPPRSQILVMLDEGAMLTAVERTELDGHACVRLTIVAEDPDRKHALTIDSDQWFERVKRVSVESEEGLRAKAEAYRQRRSLPEFRTYIFYLDLELNYALRRGEERYVDQNNAANSVLLSRSDCSDFRQLGGRQLHVPRTCVVSLFTSELLPGKSFVEPTTTRNFQVSDLKDQPIADDRFKLIYEQPGCEIIDVLDNEGARRHVVIQEDGTAKEVGR